MTRKRKVGKASDPMEIARRRAAERLAAAEPAQWGIPQESLALPANIAVDVAQDGAGRIVRARRQDVFDSLHARGRLGPAALNAVRRLQNDVACLHRSLTGGAIHGPRIDRSRAPQDFSDARRRAGERIAAALSFAGPASARLLSALCEPDVVLGRAADWRAVVATETGETLPDAQGAILRMACENLAGAYDLVDGGRGRSPRAADSV